jgi:hypothetical protein
LSPLELTLEKNPKCGGAAPLKTAKEPEKHRREPYFDIGGKKNF